MLTFRFLIDRVSNRKTSSAVIRHFKSQMVKNVKRLGRSSLKFTGAARFLILVHVTTNRESSTANFFVRRVLIAHGHGHVVDDPMLLIVQQNSFEQTLNRKLVVFAFRRIFSFTSDATSLIFKKIELKEKKKPLNFVETETRLGRTDVIRRWSNPFAEQNLTEIFNWRRFIIDGAKTETKIIRRDEKFFLSTFCRAFSSLRMFVGQNRFDRIESIDENFDLSLEKENLR